MRVETENSPKKRVISAVLGGRVDRIPCSAFSQTVTYEQMESAGAKWPEAHLVAEKMARLASATFAQTGLETARVPFDQTVEAEAMGSEMKVKGDIPAITGHVFKNYEELKIPDNFLEKARVPVILDSVEILRKMIGDALPIIAGTVGPFTLSTMIFNPTAVIKATITQPKEVSESVSSLVPLLSDYANELSKRGADIIVVEDMFSSQIGPEQFRKIAKEPLKQLIFSINAPVVLHICGNSTHIFSDMIETGPDAISIEKQTDLTIAAELARNKITLIGNIDPVSTLMRGSQSQIEESVKSAIDGGISIVAPGCSIAPRTTNESIRQMVDYTKQHGKKLID